MSKSILSPAERGHVRRIKALLDLFESQGQVHVADAIERVASDLRIESETGARERHAESQKRADEALRAWAAGSK